MFSWEDGYGAAARAARDGRQIESVHTKSLPHCDGGGRGQQEKFNANGVTIGAVL